MAEVKAPHRKKKKPDESRNHPRCCTLAEFREWQEHNILDRASIYCEDCTPEFAAEMRGKDMCDRPDITFQSFGAGVKGCLPKITKKRTAIIELVVKRRMTKFTRPEIEDVGFGKVRHALEWLIDDEALTEEKAKGKTTYTVKVDRMLELYAEEIDGGFF